MTALHKHPRTLLVIVAEAALEKPLVREVRQHGGQFWTCLLYTSPSPRDV
jgi:hypothetical protein